MKNWKDKVLGIFAGIGIMSLLMASNLQQAPKGVWQMHIADQINGNGVVFTLNTETGEVRKMEERTLSKGVASVYIVMKESDKE